MPFTMLRFERVEANCAAENDKEMIDFAQPPLSSADLSRCVGYFRNSNATETKIASSAFPTIHPRDIGRRNDYHEAQYQRNLEATLFNTYVR